MGKHAAPGTGRRDECLNAGLLPGVRHVIWNDGPRCDGRGACAQPRGQKSAKGSDVAAVT